MLHVVSLEHRRATRSISSFVGQTVFLSLHQLLSQSLEEEAIASDHILNFLLFLRHHLETFEAFSRDVMTRDLHGNLVI